jgi:Ca-activated chloride channel family protein
MFWGRFYEGCPMSFDNPKLFFYLLILLPGLAAAAFHYHKYRGALSFLVSPELPVSAELRELLKQKLRRRYWLSVSLFCLFIACVITALAGPRWGSRLVPEFGRGVDVVLALDLSRSMEVRDVPGEKNPLSRLDRAAAVARDLVRANPGVRFGIALGKGRGALALPLTDDGEAILSLLDSLSGAMVTGRGTNLEELLDAARGAFRDSLPTRRRIILFSDGEALSGSLQAALDRSLESGAVVFALGLGTEAGGPVPEAPPGDASALEEASLAEPVISFLRADVLRNAALRTGGIYVDGNRDDAAALLNAHIASLLPGSSSPGYRREAGGRWHYFIIAALAALGLSKVLEKWYGPKPL